MKLTLFSIFLFVCYYCIKGIFPQNIPTLAFKRLTSCGLDTKLLKTRPYKIASSAILCAELCGHDWKCQAVSSCKDNKHCYIHENTFQIHKCENHKIIPGCSTWEKVTPCKNNGGLSWINNTCVCLDIYSGEYCENFFPRTCKDIYEAIVNNGTTPVTGEFVLYTPDNTPINVTCEFKETIGVTYISKTSLLDMTNDELQLHIPDPHQFVMRQFLSVGKQIEAILKLPSLYTDSWMISLQNNEYFIEEPWNAQMEPFIIVAGLPSSRVYQGVQLGYNIKGNDIICKCYNNETRNYFSFHPNQYSVASTVTPTVTPNVTENVTQNVTENVTPNVTENVTQNVTETVTLNVTENVTPNVTEDVTEPVTETVIETVTLTVTSAPGSEICYKWHEMATETSTVLLNEDYLYFSNIYFGCCVRHNTSKEWCKSTGTAPGFIFEIPEM